MRIWSSAGSVTTALPLLVAAIFSLLLLEVVQHRVEGVEPVRPRELVFLDPVVDRLERAPVQAVEPPAPIPALVDRPHLAHHAEGPRDVGLARSEERRVGKERGYRGSPYH